MSLQYLFALPKEQIFFCAQKVNKLESSWCCQMDKDFVGTPGHRSGGG